MQVANGFSFTENQTWGLVWEKDEQGWGESASQSETSSLAGDGQH